MTATSSTSPTRARIVILGAGPGGLCTAIKLCESGIEDFVVLEREQEAGGTWVNNRYPGLACDVPSMLYSFSFEPKPDWTRGYARQPEIKAYMQHCVQKYGLAPHIHYGVKVEHAAWDDDRAEWTLHAADGRVFVAPIFISALGMFNEVQWPDIAGLKDFAGTLLHTAQWPAAADLSGKRVGVIGTAASAVQLLPEIAREVEHLAVFQRTPNWIFPKDDPVMSASELDALRADPARVQAMRDEQYALWEQLITFENEPMIEVLRQRALDMLETVQDPGVREKLRPTSPLGSQRPLFSNDFYGTFNRPNVELLTAPIDTITASGVRCADGRHVEVDTLVLATGYAANKFLSVIDVSGREGRTLSEAWSEGPQAYLGMTTAGFPNLFMLYGPNTNNGSILYMLELQVAYILDKIARLAGSGKRSIEVRPSVMDRYNRDLQAHLRKTIWQHEGSKYYRAASGRIVTQWPWTMAAFKARLEAPDPDAFEERGEVGKVPAPAAGRPRALTAAD